MYIPSASTIDPSGHGIASIVAVTWSPFVLRGVACTALVTEGAASAQVDLLYLGESPERPGLNGAAALVYCRDP